MKFYKIKGEILLGEDGERERRLRKDFADKIAAKTVEFNGEEKTKYCFLSAKEERFVTIGIIATSALNAVKEAERYAKYAELNVKKITTADEVTFGNLQNLLSVAGRHGYIDNGNDVLEKFDLDKLVRRRDLVFGENIVNCTAEKEALCASAKKYFMNDTILSEIERIYSGRKSRYATGHPVHYIVETDNTDTRREVYKIILDALFANKRIDNCRYAFLDFEPGDDYSREAYNSLYKMSEGGTVVVRYVAGDNLDDDCDATCEQEMIELICETAKRYRNKVLTVFCFPRNCKKIKDRFYEHLGTMAFVELKEEPVDAVSAKALLKDIARQNHIRTDKNLGAEIKEDCTYVTSEIQTMFDKWYDKKLTTTIYPQYKDIAAARKDEATTKPQGSAYSELMEMIGLSEAKKVINKALNYYKMQKLYEEKGIKRDNPAMHMIFSGNPGTAKTTVARLFAGIMRENGLLPKGQLVEVGRGDLVGKYVGWTASVVKSKFKAASGGVLFIDEAYSLVDDRDGSYGDEAINTIVQELENHRDDVVVIFAGYPGKMEGFLQKNPGLRSRIAFHIPFADYSSEELCQIAGLISKKNGMSLEKAALDKLEKVFAKAKNEGDFGNGRYVRNVFEQAKMNQASRLLDKDFDAITADEITTITADDIIVPEPKAVKKICIGFC